MAINLAFGFSATGGEMLSSSEWTILKNEAINYAKKAIELNPDEAFSYFSLAFVFAQSKMLSKSKEQNKIALELEPENLLALQMKATNLINDGLFEEGLQAFKTVRKIDPLFPIFVLMGEARALLALGKYEEAYKISEEALIRNPRADSAMLSFIAAAWRTGNTEDAQWQLEEFLLKREQLNFSKDDFENFVNKYPWHDINKNLIKSVYREMLKKN